jgi:hypothetical protein
MLFPETDNWRAGMQEVSTAIDETMGELVPVTPAEVQKPNFPSVADPSRTVTVTAVFTSKAENIVMGEGRAYGGHSISPFVSTSKPVFQFGDRTLPFAIKQSYRITRLCSGETFEVTDVKPDGVSRITRSTSSNSVASGRTDNADIRATTCSAARRSKQTRRISWCPRFSSYRSVMTALTSLDSATSFQSRCCPISHGRRRAGKTRQLAVRLLMKYCGDLFLERSLGRYRLRQLKTRYPESNELSDL